MPNIKHCIFDSSGMSLHFLNTDEDIYSEYTEALEKLQIETYKKLRARNGIWANNQYKYVKTVGDLNSLDTTYMEDLLIVRYNYAAPRS